jgi:hypothetical protein
MKRSQRISLRLIPVAAAAFLAACEAGQQRTCVDPDGRVVADANCSTQPSTGSTASWGAGSPGGYHWYWYRGPGPIIGYRAPFGGSYSAPASSESVRGGFGATAAGHAGAGS